jgi:hypothetical protein
MAGKSKVVRSIQSLINKIDNNCGSGPMKMGTAPSVGITHNYWHNLQTQCNTKAGKPKKSYNNMVFLNINPAQTPVPSGFTPNTNYNYSYVPNQSLPNYFADYNKKYHNHFYRPYLPNKQIVVTQEIVDKYQKLYSNYLASNYKN